MEDTTDNIMKQPPGHPNNGLGKAANDDGEWGTVPLDVSSQQVADLLTPNDGLEIDAAPFGAGVGIVDTARGQGTVGTYGATDAGMTAHRGTLHPDEYVDYFVLRAQVEADLGFSYSDVSEAYANGRPTAEQRQLREKIDARLLALSRAGGNMEQLAKALGLNEKTLRRSLLRAREIEVDAIVKNPAVVKPLVCFKTGELGATLRKRRFSDSPPQWTGSVALCDDEYAKGFDRKPGNPAYWDFRDARTPLRGGPDRPAKRAQRFPADYPSDQAYADFLGR
jgi:hypothetical protein